MKSWPITQVKLLIEDSTFARGSTEVQVDAHNHFSSPSALIIKCPPQVTNQVIPTQKKGDRCDFGRLLSILRFF
jgi:hypothetical protein